MKASDCHVRGLERPEAAVPSAEDLQGLAALLLGSVCLVESLKSPENQKDVRNPYNHIHIYNHTHMYSVDISG